MRRLGWFVGLAGLLMAVNPGWAAAPHGPGQGDAVVTILPKHGDERAVNIEVRDLEVKVSGGLATVTGWTRLRGADGDLEVVVLIDDGSSPDLSNQFGDIAAFLNGLPPGTKAGVAYMQNGRAVLAGPLSTNHAAVAAELRLPTGIIDASASPYFCLSDLARHWPSKDSAARREVVMITNGVDEYGQWGDLQDPYVEASIHDSVKSGLVVYGIYWSARAGFGNGAGSLFGQSLMGQVADATGGGSYWTGSINPVSLKPFLKDISWRMENQYRLSFDAKLSGKAEVKPMSLHVGGPAAKVVAPRRVYVKDRSGE